MSMTDLDQPRSAKTPRPPGPPRDTPLIALLVVFGVLLAGFALMAFVLLGVVFLRAGSASDNSDVATNGAQVWEVNEPADPEPDVPAAVAESSIPAAPSTAAEPAEAVETPAPADECSARSAAPAVAMTELPAAVEATRVQIIDAARSCDYERLAAMIGSGFVASQGGGDPIELWQSQEAAGLAPLAKLVTLLSLDSAVITTDDGPEDANSPHTYVVWPIAAAYEAWAEVPEADKDAVRLVHTEEDFVAFDEFGYYAGYRLGIEDDGIWRYFLAGD